MRLAHRCGKLNCQLRWELCPRIGATYQAVRSKSGRRWRVWREDRARKVTLVPLGGGWGSGGSVKPISVEWDRLYNAGSGDALMRLFRAVRPQ